MILEKFSKTKENFGKRIPKFVKILILFQKKKINHSGFQEFQDCTKFDEFKKLIKKIFNSK